MGKGEEEIEKLVERVKKLIEVAEGLLPVLSIVVEDLKEASASLKSMVMPVALEIRERTATIEDVRAMFTEDLKSLLSFEEKAEYIIIKPRQFLGSENFAKIASIVRGAGGDYVSAGKESHFRVPKRRA